MHKPSSGKIKYNMDNHVKKWPTHIFRIIDEILCEFLGINDRVGQLENKVELLEGKVAILVAATVAATVDAIVDANDETPALQRPMDLGHNNVTRTLVKMKMATAHVSGVTKIKRGPGRPKKVHAVVATDIKIKRGPGRPRKAV